MSFADFLRVHWQEPEREGDRQRRRNGHANDFEDGHVENDEDEGIDNAIVDFIETHHIVLPSQSSEDSLQATHQSEDEIEGESRDHRDRRIESSRQQLESTIRGTLQRAAADNVDQNSQNSDQETRSQFDDSDSDGEYNPGEDSDEEEEDDNDLDDEFEEEDEDVVNEDDEGPPIVAPNGNGGFDPLDPVLQDDQVVSMEKFFRPHHV